MQSSNLKINNRAYLTYKFYNSLFLGLSIGSIFTIYASLDPSIYSIGGVVLAIFMIIIAKQYKKILNVNAFFKISLGVELVILFVIASFLAFSYSYTTALLVYAGYQVTFIFGSYLVRAETMILNNKQLLTFIDVKKQQGYLIGMALSFGFYQVMEKYFLITDNQIKVYDLHFVLLVLELVILYFLLKAFKRSILPSST
jgi:hypothetical protein